MYLCVSLSSLSLMLSACDASRATGTSLEVIGINTSRKMEAPPLHAEVIGIYLKMLDERQKSELPTHKCCFA